IPTNSKMKPLTPIGSPSPLRLLNKGPDYLRRQMDAGSRSRSVSAVERLEADKAKYVKSQQVINTKQEPVLVPCATPPPVPRRNLTVSTPSTPVLPPRNQTVPFSAPLFSRDENVDNSRKENCRNETDTSSSRDGDSRMSWSIDKDTVDGGNETRRSSKSEREHSMPETQNDNTGFQEKQSKNCMINSLRNSTGNANNNDMDPWKPVLPQMRSYLKRSKSELRLRCSLAMSEQERFFDYCGLDLDMVERLGPENFLNGASSVDTLSLLLRSVRGGGSEPSEFSRHSGEGLFQEELAEQIPTGVSIIERNARVIKWLYGSSMRTSMLFCVSHI
uniref:Protein FAM110C-like n=1 Tax=Sinocyclocheilus grahami TaxID=75366 RepID=A0A672KXV1_SINGR